MSRDKSAANLTPLCIHAKKDRCLLGNRGFTLIELIIVSAILAILTGLAIPAYSSFKEKARSARAMEEIRGIEKVIYGYTIDHGGALPPAPLTVAALGIVIPLTDPWGNAYVYVPNVGSGGRWGHAEVLNTDFDLYSHGTNGVSDPVLTNSINNALNGDDIVRASNGIFVGLGSHF